MKIYKLLKLYFHKKRKKGKILEFLLGNIFKMNYVSMEINVYWIKIQKLNFCTNFICWRNFISFESLVFKNICSAISEFTTEKCFSCKVSVFFKMIYVSMKTNVFLIIIQKLNFCTNFICSSSFIVLEGLVFKNIFQNEKT